MQELGDDLEMVILGLMMEPVEFSAKCLYDSMYGSGTDERLLSYIILSCKPEASRQTYRRTDICNDRESDSLFLQFT